MGDVLMLQSSVAEWKRCGRRQEASSAVGRLSPCHNLTHRPTSVKLMRNILHDLTLTRLDHRSLLYMSEI